MGGIKYNGHDNCKELQRVKVKGGAKSELKRIESQKSGFVKGVTSASFFNAGDDEVIVNGAALKPGETVVFVAPNKRRLNPIPYDTTASTGTIDLAISKVY